MSPGSGVDPYGPATVESIYRERVQTLSADAERVWSETDSRRNAMELVLSLKAENERLRIALRKIAHGLCLDPTGNSEIAQRALAPLPDEDQ